MAIEVETQTLTHMVSFVLGDGRFGNTCVSMPAVTVEMIQAIEHELASQFTGGVDTVTVLNLIKLDT